MFIIKSCPATGKHDPAVVLNSISKVQSALPPELRDDAVVGTILNHSATVALRSAAVTSTMVTAGAAPAPAVAPASASALTHTDIEKFVRLVANQALRRTPSTPNPNDPGNIDPFWTRLKAYYIAYYDGTFSDYFGTTYTKPSASLTISDTEIVQAASVFIEALLDEILGSTVWIDSSGIYYPGGKGSKAPTSLTFSGIKPTSISTTWTGCGMNTFKADSMRYLSTSFAQAASTESDLTIKSAGGIEVGLGILGKLNIGDNTTLTQLVRAVVSEIVSRLTVRLATPILEAIDFEQQPASSVASPAASVALLSASLNRTPTAKAQKAQITRAMTSLFVSAK